jgi:glutathione S-transferase
MSMQTPESQRPVVHIHPVSTTSRPLMMFAAEAGLAIDWRVVDLFSGEQTGAAFTALNPNQAVPVLVHDGFVLTESCAILKYLADWVASPAYPKALRERARVNAAMDWLNTGLMRELCYGLVYPQVMPHLRRPDEAAQAAVLDWARPRATQQLALLDQWLIGPRRHFLLGDSITLADYQAVGILTLGETIDMDYSAWPHIQRWLAGMKARPAYRSTHAAFEAFAADLRHALQPALA